MADTESENARLWIAAWRRAAPELERIRREEMDAHDTPYYVERMSGLYMFSNGQHDERTTTGLVEMQRLLHSGIRCA